MNKRGFIGGVAIAAVGSFLLASPVFAQEASPVDEAKAAVAFAEKAVEDAKAAIASGKQLLATIPEDSPLMSDVAEAVKAASENWKVAVESMEGAKATALKIDTAPNESVANDFALLAEVNAGVALSGAKVVQIAINYVDVVANNKAEALDIVRTALQDAVAASSQVQFNCERVKTYITEKYSK